MSRSYKKEPYYSCKVGSFKEWKQITNRKFRSRSKQILEKCEDWENLILPHKYEIWDIWDSPKDGMMWRQKVPYINQCEVDIYQARNSWYSSFSGYFERRYKPTNEHLKDCNCYSNKRNSSYWRMMRK